MKKQYGRAVRHQLQQFPVWDIGAPVSVGDYGLVEKNCFTRMGSLSEFEIEVVAAAAGPPAFWQFTSQGTKVVDSEITGNPVGKLELSFAAAHSLYVRADGSSVATMKDPNSVGELLRADPRWDRKHCYVSSVRSAKNLVLLMNTSNSSRIHLKGPSELLAQVVGGSCTGEVGIEITGDVGFQSIGVAGAFCVELMHVGVFRTRIKDLVGAEDDEQHSEPEESVVPVDPLHDYLE